MKVLSGITVLQKLTDVTLQCDFVPFFFIIAATMALKYIFSSSCLKLQVLALPDSCKSCPMPLQYSRHVISVVWHQHPGTVLNYPWRPFNSKLLCRSDLTSSSKTASEMSYNGKVNIFLIRNIQQANINESKLFFYMVLLHTVG